MVAFDLFLILDLIATRLGRPLPPILQRRLSRPFTVHGEEREQLFEIAGAAGAAARRWIVGSHQCFELV